MDFLIAIDQKIQGHIWLPLTIILALVIWIAITRYFFDEATRTKYPCIVATVDLVLIPSAIMSIGGLLYFVLQENQFSIIQPQLQFVVHLMAILAISWCTARFVEIFL